tara:strand:+ start:2798 stop:3133 length:336 start_codon:yes stop_codon:yes gene_type:complete
MSNTTTTENINNKLNNYNSNRIINDNYVPSPVTDTYIKPTPFIFNSDKLHTKKNEDELRFTHIIFTQNNNLNCAINLLLCFTILCLIYILINEISFKILNLYNKTNKYGKK